MTIEFFKSDAMSDLYPEEPIIAVIELDENLQLTYNEMRDTTTGKTFARMNTNNHWILDFDGTHWSDVACYYERLD